MEKNKMTAYDRLLIARSKERMLITDYIDGLFEDFIELKGDRLFREDASILGGIALFHGIPVTVIGHRKGHTTQENIAFNFGMTSPEGYRKALRLMKEAEKFKRPVITFIDTPGAYPGMEAESNGQANAIAECLAKMSTLKTPIIAIVTGEGNSGGALAIGVADRVWMLENAVYSILSPEGFSSIMWKDPKRVQEACEIMKLTAQNLKEYGLIDDVISEGKSNVDILMNIDRKLQNELRSLMSQKETNLVHQRYKKYRNIEGVFAPDKHV